MKRYNWSNKNILIIEDNKTNMVLLEHMLKASTNVNLFFGKNSKEFYEYINNKQLKLDLILMDISLNEDVTGIDLTNYLINNNINIPVILQTAYDVEDFDYPNSGNVIRKPINRIILLEMIDEIFNPYS